MLANRNNIQPELRSITLVVMVLFCLFFASTFQSIGAWQLTISNSVVSGATSLKSFWKLQSFASLNKLAFICLGIFFISLFMPAPAFFALIVFFLIFLKILFSFARFSIFPQSFFGNNLTLFVLLIFFFTHLTLAATTILRGFSFMKFVEDFSSLAFGAGLCYITGSHRFLLTRKLWLEPVTAHIVVGLSYHSMSQGGIK